MMKTHNKSEMINQISKMEEFKDYPQEDLQAMTYEELGAILGYWQVGDGGVQ